jgi:hypothetical protein
MLHLFCFNGWEKPGQEDRDYTIGKVYTVNVGDWRVLADDGGDPRVFFPEDFTYVGPAPTEESKKCIILK